MSIASEWRSEKRRREDVPAPPAMKAQDIGEEITRRILQETDDGSDPKRAAKTVAGGLWGQRVTFRRNSTVRAWPCDGNAKRTFDELSEVFVAARARGRTVTVMIDGRTLVEVDNGLRVLVRVGTDCKLLRWWHRLSDWWAGAGW